jgi:hypothetical protein
MVFGFASSRFGIVKVNKPSLYSAFTFSALIEFGSEKLRAKDP